MTSTSAPRRLPAGIAVTIDAALVVIFCITGRMSHAEGILGDVPGTLNTIWPFLVAVLVAHGVGLLRGIRADRMLPGVAIWAVTVAGGLTLRALSGQGTALPFVIVATLTLALLLLGWRAVLAVVRRARRSAGSPAQRQ